MTGNNQRPTVESTEAGTERVDWSNDIAPSTVVVEAVARTLDCSPTELESLDKTVDTDALNALFAPRHDGTQRGSGSVSFSYGDRDVTVFSDGRVVVEQP